MVPPPPDSNQVFFSPRSRRLGRIGGLVLAAVGTLVVLGGIEAVRDQGESWVTVVLWTWPVIFGVAEFLRAGSIAVVVTNDAILVRNEFRQRRIAWDAATRLIWRPQSMLVSTGYIARKKGRPIRSAAFRTFSESPGPEYLAFAEESIVERLDGGHPPKLRELLAALDPKARDDLRPFYSASYGWPQTFDVLPTPGARCTRDKVVC